MERKWYKRVNREWQEAPQQIEIDGAILFNYNCESNEAMLRADGYLPENEIE